MSALDGDNHQETLSPDSCNPYQPPETVDVDTAGDPVLWDPRLLGRVALICITAQCVCWFYLIYHGQDEVWNKQIQTAQTVSALLSAMFYLIWLYRCTVNVRRMNPLSQASPGWAVVCHFIPFVNMVAPCLVLRRLAKETFVHRSSEGLPILAIFWWIALLTRGVWPGEPNYNLTVVMIGVGATVVAWVGMAIIVTRVSERQASFRWSDLPTSLRVALLPLAPARRGSITMTDSGSPRPPMRSVLKPQSYEAQIAEIEAEDARTPPESVPNIRH